MDLKFVPPIIAVVPFPLTLTLSLREREQPGSMCENSNRARYAGRLAPVLPLPEGEGWGEGEATVPVVEAQIPKPETAAGGRELRVDFRVSFGFRHSDFGFCSDLEVL